MNTVDKFQESNKSIDNLVNLSNPKKNRQISKTDFLFFENEQLFDIKLIKRIANRDESAIALLYDRYKTILFSVLVRILNSKSEAENVLQEVFIQVWQQAGIFDLLHNQPFTWLITITNTKVLEKSRYPKTQIV
jgi:Sigma-70 region 2